MPTSYNFLLNGGQRKIVIGQWWFNNKETYAHSSNYTYLNFSSAANVAFIEFYIVLWYYRLFIIAIDVLTDGL